MFFFKHLIRNFLFKYFYFLFNHYRKYKIQTQNNKFKKKSMQLANDVSFNFFDDPKLDWESCIDENKLIIDILKKSKVFVDVGANTGFYSCISLALKKQTIAIEPISENVNMLIKNIQINKFNDIEIYPVAAADKNSFLTIYGHGVTASLYKNWDNVLQNRISEKIPTLTLDTILGDKFIDKQIFIMIDNENAQYVTLLGSKKILSSKIKPIWLVEIFSDFSIEQKITSVKKTYYQEVFDIFTENNYDCFFCFEDEKDTIKQLNKDDLQKIKENKIDWIGGHFLFANKGKILIETGKVVI